VWALPRGSSVATGLLKISPDLRSKKIKKPYKEKSSNLQIPPKLTPKMLHNFALSTNIVKKNAQMIICRRQRRRIERR